MIILLYALLSAAMFYLGSRAKITEAIWSLYPQSFARFMDCAACTGFWWGLIWHVVIGARFEIDLGPMPAGHVATPLIAGLCTLVLTPIVAAMMHYGLAVLGSAVPAEDDVNAIDEDALLHGAPPSTSPHPVDATPTQALRTRLEALTGDQVFDLIEACLNPTLSANPAWGLSADDMLSVRALIATYAQTKLLDASTWRGRLPPSN